MWRRCAQARVELHERSRVGAKLTTRAVFQEPHAGGSQIWPYDAGQFVAPTSEESTVSSLDVGSTLALASGPKSGSKIQGPSGPQILGQKARWTRQQLRLRASMANIRLQSSSTLAPSILKQAPLIWTGLLASLISGSLSLLLPANRRQAAHVVPSCHGRANAHLDGACCLCVCARLLRVCGQACYAAAVAP